MENKAGRLSGIVTSYQERLAKVRALANEILGEMRDRASRSRRSTQPSTFRQVSSRRVASPTIASATPNGEPKEEPPKDPLPPRKRDGIFGIYEGLLLAILAEEAGISSQKWKKSLAEILSVVQKHFKSESFGVIFSMGVEIIHSKKSGNQLEIFWRGPAKTADAAQLSTLLFQALWMDFQRPDPSNLREAAKVIPLPDLLHHCLRIHFELTSKYIPDFPRVTPFLSFVTQQTLQLILASKGGLADRSPRTTELMRSVAIFFLADLLGDALSMPEGPQLLSRFHAEATLVLREFVGPLNQQHSFAGKDSGVTFTLLCGAYELASGKTIPGFQGRSPKNMSQTLNTVVESFIDDLNGLKAAIVESGDMGGLSGITNPESSVQLSLMEDSVACGEALKAMEPNLNVCLKDPRTFPG